METSGTDTAAAQRRQAFDRFVRPELEVLLRVALRLTGNPADAEDLVQDTLLRAYRAIDRFDGRHPRAWLLTILRNANINRVRRRRPDLLDDEELWSVPSSHPEGQPQEALAALPDPRLVAALRQLSRKHREVVALVDVDGLTYQEAADLLGIPIGTVMSRLHRARARLRKLLEEQGVLGPEGLR